MLWRNLLVCSSDTGLKGIRPNLISRILVITAEPAVGPTRLSSFRILSPCLLWPCGEEHKATLLKHTVFT